MANVACLCWMTHSMIGTILKTPNQAVSEMQCRDTRKMISKFKEMLTRGRRISIDSGNSLALWKFGEGWASMCVETGCQSDTPSPC